MCPSDIYELPLVPGQVFGPETEVFRAEDSYPCSIVLRDIADASIVRIQVRTESSEWRDYIEGDLIIGRSVMCRMSAPGLGVPTNLKIEVFHT